ncbi:hypothetical protein DHW03_10385 [Pedobacter yonginense]|uniref:Peptidase M56 domain-containing protein n=2 Tax=Pedobacter yonginense TaxID=651869 RepID=A0A317ENS4_9SPHI|nr:hypothetical protein DHW03_10385 [Pedobacter yonginense]
MAIFPFILLKSERLMHDQEIINHEKIHLRQQLELLVVPFYVLYLLNYLVNRLKYGDHHLAYRNIIFEKEAYNHESDLSYLQKGSWFGWLKRSK